MQIIASMVKELRERTGAGMMDCKNALKAADGDIENAIKDMRKSGVAKAAKKTGRAASEGQIVVSHADGSSDFVILEVNCETDFVGKDENFRQFTQSVAATILKNKPNDIDELLTSPVANSTGMTVEEARTQLIAKIGENISVRRFSLFTAKGTLGSYLHGVRIGVLTDIDGGDDELAKDIAMHIAASKPVCIDKDEIPSELIEKEREIYLSQAQESDKPAEIIDKMVSGRINKYLNEVTLLGQHFIKDPDVTVAKLLENRNTKVNSFIRYEVGDGIEKKVDNFAEDVMAQVKDN